MYKLFFSLFAFVIVSSQVQAVQIIHRSNGNRNAQETYELNQQEERQELLRRQIRLQEQQLQAQQQALELQRQQQQQYRR